MIKKILLALAIALPSMAFAQAKFGVIDAQAVMDVMPETKEANDKLAAASKTYEAENDKLAEEFQKKQQEYQALAADTPAAIRAAREAELQELYTRIEGFANQARQDLARQQQTLMMPIQEKVLNAIKAVGSEQGFSMIFPDGVSFYTGSDVIDVTAAVKAKLGI